MRLRASPSAASSRNTSTRLSLGNIQTPKSGELSVDDDSKRLFALSEDKGLTQTQLADALGTTQRVISYYETDAELPPAAAIVPLARLLEVSTDHLLGLEPAAQGGRQQPQQQRLWKRFQKMEALPTKDQRAVIRLINSLAGAA